MEEPVSKALLAEFDVAKLTAKRLFKGCNSIPSGIELTQRAIAEALGAPPYDLEFIKDNFSALVSDLQAAAYGYYLASERDICGAALADYVKLQMKNETVDGSLDSLKDSFFILDRFFLDPESITSAHNRSAGCSLSIR